MVWNRRQVVTGALATLIGPRLPATLSASTRSPAVDQNLIPSTPSRAASYFCTWAAQNYIFGDGAPTMDIAKLQGDSGAQLAREAMNASRLLGKSGWAATFHPKARQDLYLLLDDGWEMGGMASFELDTRKFPAFSGSAEERLRALQNTIAGDGWKGTGLWCRNTPGGTKDREYLQRSVKANINYWKIDLGDPKFDLIGLRNQLRLPLTLEHVNGEPPLNGNWREDGRFGAQAWDSPRVHVFRNTDVYRTYDVTSILSLPTTLDRVAEMMLAVQGHPEVKTLLNVEDEVYVAAVLGCTAGILRHPLHGLRPGSDVDLFFNGPRQAKRRMDEVVRAMRWQRIAHPFPPGQSTVHVDDVVLTDSWTFRQEETWREDIVGVSVKQGAPAVIARDLPLPLVRTSGERPFVFATRFPNGAVAIGAQERTRTDRAWFMPSAEVLLDVGDTPGPFGIFGYFRELTLRTQYSLTGKRILAQDLAGKDCFDITSEVRLQHNTLTLSKRVIETYGLEASSPNDLSAPGLVVLVS